MTEIGGVVVGQAMFHRFFRNTSFKVRREMLGVSFRLSIASWEFETLRISETALI